MKVHRKALLIMSMLLACGSIQAQANGTWKDSYVLEAAGKYEQAASVLEPILRGSPNHELALMRRAWLNYLQGRHNEAMRDYTQVLWLNPNALDARLGLTLPLMAQKRWSEAAVEARKVTAVSAWDYTAHLRLLICEEAEQKWDEMAKHAAALVVRYPTDANFMVYLARAEAWRGNTKAAKGYYAKVTELVPSHIEAENYLKTTP